MSIGTCRLPDYIQTGQIDPMFVITHRLALDYAAEAETTLFSTLCSSGKLLIHARNESDLC